MQGPHYNTLYCLTMPRTWHPIDVAHWQTIDGLVLPKSHAILDASCRSLVHRFHEVPGVPQSLKSLRENRLQTICSIGEIIEQNLQANKQKISGSAHIIIRINKHYSHIIHDVPHLYSWMSHASRLLAAHLDCADVKLLSSRTRNQACGSQFAQLPAKKAARHRSGRLPWSATNVQFARCPGTPHYCT
jgi:hypothetical protein